MRVLGVLALAYLASPFDPPPGSSLLLGHLDDLAILALGALLLLRSAGGEAAPGEAVRRGRWTIRLGRLVEDLRAVPKTLLFNFRYFPPGIAIRFPVVVRHTVHLKALGGTVELAGDWRPGGIKLGFGNEGAFDRAHERTVWNVHGAVTIGQDVSVIHGARISVGERGRLVIGARVLLNAGATLMCNRRIAIGSGTRLAWDTLVMDSDFHELLDEDGRRTNPDAAVTIGEGVWIGARAILLKGSVIADGCVVGAGSLVVGRHAEPATLIAGNPARAKRRPVAWRA